ncbi:MAG TPA: cysteine synthase B, partial [Dehalococcoidia bacterium]|nr:cysteine synthase B [Dehalococcoidia bacterium]
TKQLLFICGDYAGITYGAVVAAARKVATKMEKGKNVLLIADSGEKYISSGLWTKEYNEIEKSIENKIWW